jgi:hypothetical protein
VSLSRRAPGIGFLAAALAAAALGLSTSACKRAASTGPVRLAAGDAVWFEDGVASAADDTEATVAKGGFASVFLPAVELVHEGERWSTRELAAPEKPFQRIPVYLIVSAPADAEASLHDARNAAALADAAGLAAKLAVRNSPKFGTLRGVHLDIPFGEGAADGIGAVLRTVREKVSREILLTWSLRYAPAEGEREKLKAAIAPADGAVAFVFGDAGGAEPVATDQLDRPWLAAFAPGARGRPASASADSDVRYPESVLAKLTDDPRVEFAHDLSLKEESASAFLLTPHEAIRVGPYSFANGQALQFRQPSLSDMVFRFGADLAGRRFVRGRAVAVSGKTEADRIFTLAALNDILLGHPLNTDLRVTIEPGRSSIAVSAENPTPHASLVSRTSNWVEVDLPAGGIVDVKAGGFDRFEVFGSNNEPVTLGLATRIRFFETLLSPWEKIQPAQVTLRRAPGKDCCAHRIHVLSSAGAEIAREGDAVATPSPVKSP